MRLVKLIVTLVILGLIALFIGQNMGTWNSAIPFKFELPLLGVSGWTIELYLVMLFSALIGLIAGAVLLMKPYFNLRRTIAQERKGKKEVSLEVKESQAQAAQAS